MIGRRGFITGLVALVAAVILVAWWAERPRPFVCETDGTILHLPAGDIDAGRWDQIVRDFAAHGHCVNVRGAGRDKTIVERR